MATSSGEWIGWVRRIPQPGQRSAWRQVCAPLHSKADVRKLFAAAAYCDDDGNSESWSMVILRAGEHPAKREAAR